MDKIGSILGHIPESLSSDGESREANTPGSEGCQLENDLVFEAAHNLSLIYILSGNFKAAKEITERYLVL